VPKRKHFSASQKAQIALEILKEEKTVSQIASEYGVHPNVLYRWKKQVLENLPKLFEDEKKKRAPVPGVRLPHPCACQRN
jgi:putative transposase